MSWLGYGTGILVVILSIAIHELGHRKMAWHLGYKSEIRIEKMPGKKIPNIVTTWWGKKNTAENERKILLAGLLAGLVPIVFFTVALDYVGVIPVLMVWTLYYFVSKDDIKQLQEVIENEL